MTLFQIKSIKLLTIFVIISTVLISVNDKPILAGSDIEGCASEGMLKKGTMAPDFTLENINGEMVSLKDFAGSILVLGMVFGDKAAHNIEKYRRQINYDFKGKEINFLKVVQVSKPIFITKEFIQSKMKKQFTDSPDAPKYTLVDWEGSLDLGEKYCIKDRDTPAVFIIGKNGEILFSFQGWYSKENLSKLDKELSATLDGPSEFQGDIVRIGVTQIAFHRSFEQGHQGFKTALDEAGYVEGKNIKFDRQNAQGDLDKNTQIALKFMRDKVDLIVTMSSPAAQFLVDMVKEIPMVYSIVTRPVENGIVPTMEPSGTNVTGVGVHVCPIANQWPVDSQLEMYIKIVPEAKRWGTIYNSKSVNSRYHIDEIKKMCQRLGLELIEADASKPENVGEAVRSLLGKVDALYIISDEIPLSGFEHIADVCNQNRIPLFGGELECVPKGAIAAYNQDYFLTGYKAGEKAIRILKGEKPGDIPSELTKKFYLVISLKNAEKQGVTIPEELKKMADKIM